MTNHDGHPEDPRGSPASPRALQELAETVQRSRLGGPFYVLAWFFCGLAGDLAQLAPVVFLLVGLAFVALGVPRYTTRALAPGAAAHAVRRRLDFLWGVVLVNSALWGAASTGLLLTSADESTRTVTAVASYAFSTAFAHNFCMRRGRALTAIGLIYLPTMAAYLFTDARFEFVAIGLFYLVYVVLALRRSHAEYLQRLNLEDELRSQRDQFQQQSQRDGLTGLANRRRFGTLLEQWVEESRTTAGTFSLLILDLDWFKSINDRHGHTVGDACLRAFATELQRAFSTGHELVARLGGEEFAVLIRDCPVPVAAQRAEKFRQSLAAQPLALGDLAIDMTVSIGIGAFAPQAHADGGALYHAVDAALYRAKASGRNAVCTTAVAG